MVSASTNPMGFFVTPNHGIYRLVVYYRSTDAMPSPAPASLNIVSQHLPFLSTQTLHPRPFTRSPSVPAEMERDQRPADQQVQRVSGQHPLYGVLGTLLQTPVYVEPRTTGTPHSPVNQSHSNDQ